MNRPWKKDEPVPIAPEVLAECTLEQLSRMGKRFKLDLEVEGKTYLFCLCDESQLTALRDDPRHVLTFREMREALRCATYQRVLHGTTMSMDDFLALTDRARKMGMVLDAAWLEEAEEPACTLS